jgi:outer membrane lipoprotein-sorting protein
MKRFYLIIFILFFLTNLNASTKNELITNLKNINNLTFDFEQNVNGKIENGNCILEYPKKIFCKYNLKNEKILVSNGKSLVIKTLTSYYLYPLKRTPLDLILNKEFLINKINNLNERIVEDKFINYKFIENENEINIYFDKKNYNLIGWQTTDVYQNLSITYLSNIIKNKNLKKNIFNLPKQN